MRQWSAVQDCSSSPCVMSQHAGVNEAICLTACAPALPNMLHPKSTSWLTPPLHVKQTLLRIVLTDMSAMQLKDARGHAWTRHGLPAITYGAPTITLTSNRVAPTNCSDKAHRTHQGAVILYPESWQLCSPTNTAWRSWATCTNTAM
jgi:hypothetical protein